MSTLATLSQNVSQLDTGIRLTLNSMEAIAQQQQELEQTREQLQQVQAEVQPFREKLQSKINQIDALRLAQGAIAIGKLILNVGGDDNDDWFTSFLLELALDLGDEFVNGFLDEAIRDEAGLRLAFKSLNELHQSIEAGIRHSDRLQELAGVCASSAAIVRILEHPSPSLTLEELEQHSNDFALQLKLVFPFGNPQNLRSQLQNIRQVIEQIRQIELKLSKVSSAVESGGDRELNPAFLEALFSLLGSSLTAIEYDRQGSAILTLHGEAKPIEEVISRCCEIAQKFKDLHAFAERFLQFGKDCCQNANFVQLLATPPSVRTWDNCNAMVRRVIHNIPQQIALNSSSRMQAQLLHLKQNQSQAKKLYNRLEVATQNHNARSDLPLTPKSLGAIISLLGSFFTELGVNQEGVLIFQGSQGQETVRDVLTKLSQFQTQLKVPLFSSLHLSKLAEQCLQNTNFIQQIETQRTLSSFAELETQTQSLIQGIPQKLDFVKPKKLQEQIDRIQATIEQLQPVGRKLSKLVQVTDSKTGIALNPVTLGVFISLFGSIDCVKFDRDGHCVIVRGQETRTGKDWLKQCNQLAREIQAHLQQGKQQLQLAQQCLQDTTLRKRLAKEQRNKQMQISAIAASLIAIALSPIGWFGWRIFQSYQVQAQARQQVAAAGNIEQLLESDDLKTARQQIQNAIALLETLPNLPGSAYSRAQTDRVAYISQLNAIDQKLQTQAQSRAGLDQAQRLAMEAATLVQNPPHPASVWREAGVKWQAAIDSLAASSGDATMAAEVQQKLKTFQKNADAIAQRIKTEDRAEQNLKKAHQLLTDTAASIDDPIALAKTWNETRAYCQQVFQLLANISPSTDTFARNQMRIQADKDRCTELQNQLASKQTSLEKLNQILSLETQALQFARKTPYALPSLTTALLKFEKATKLLNALSSDTTIAQQVQFLRNIYQKNSQKIRERIQELESCKRFGLSSCEAAEKPLPLDSSN